MRFELEDAIPILSQTPATLRSFLARLPDQWVETSRDPGYWHPYDVLGHLIHGERADWIPRARIILEEGASRPFDPFDRKAMFEESRGKSLEMLLDEFEALRAENLATLASWSLTESDLEKEGSHPGLGRVTLGQLLATWAVHDLNHIVQISRVMALKYTGEVGPWIQYLGVLST